MLIESIILSLDRLDATVSLYLIGWRACWERKSGQCRPSGWTCLDNTHQPVHCK